MAVLRLADPLADAFRTRRAGGALYVLMPMRVRPFLFRRTLTRLRHGRAKARSRLECPAIHVLDIAEDDARH